MSAIQTNADGLNDQIVKDRLKSGEVRARYHRLRAELRDGGAVAYDLWLPETHYLPFIIHPDEHIRGTVYGRYHVDGTVGRGVLVATDRRILFLDKKPLYVHYDEITYDALRGITRTGIGFINTVTLHVKGQIFTVRTFNPKNAANFVNYVATHYIEKEEKEGV